jgi:transcriptional regulator with XRE-family HTH domain
MMIDKYEIGKRIREIRKHLKYKQKVFAVEVGVTPSYLSEIEIGRKSPGMELMLAMVNKFNVDIRYLFHGEGDYFRKTDKDKIHSTGPEVPDDTWSAEDRLAWLIVNIPLVRYAMLEHFIGYSYDKKKLIDVEIKRYQEQFKEEAGD